MTSNGRGSAKKSVRGSSVSGPVVASKVIIFHCILPKARPSVSIIGQLYIASNAQMP